MSPIIIRSSINFKKQKEVAHLEEHTHFHSVKDKCSVSSFDQRGTSEELILQ